MDSVARTYEVYGLYCACHPERGIRYVGLTTTGFLSRLAQHLYTSRGPSKQSVYMWIRKHGEQNVRSMRLEVYPDELAMNQGEKGYIAMLRSIRQADLNMNDGGSGNPGAKYSTDTRRKMSESAKKRGISQAARESARSRYGSKHPRARLNESQVSEIKKMLWSGTTCSEVAEIFSVSMSAIAHIDKERGWTHVAWPIGPRCKPRTSERQSLKAAGRKHTEEWKAATSARSKAYSARPEVKAARRAAKLGKPLDPEVVLKVAKAHAKLSDSEVRFIRDAISWGVPRGDILSMFPEGYLSVSQYNRIRTRSAYHWVE